MTARGGSAFGAALARVIGEAVHHAAIALLPHHHAERLEAQGKLAAEIVREMQPHLAEIAQHCLDLGGVHPLIEPILKTWAKGR